MKKWLENNLSRMVNSSLLAVIVLIGLGQNFGVALAPLYIVLLALGTILFLSICSTVKLRGRLIILTSLLICLVVTTMVVGRESMWNFGKDYLAWIWGEFSENDTWNNIYQVFQVILLTAICFFVQRLAEKSLSLQLAVAVVGLVWLFAALFTSGKMEQLCVVCILGYVAISYVKCLQKFWRKRKCNPDRPYLPWIQPFIIVYIVLLALTPTPEKPYDWKIFKDAYDTINETVITVSQNLFRSDREDFYSSMRGFSEEGKILGSAEQTNQVSMLLESESTMKTNVYLMGKVYDAFSGNQWQQTYEEQASDRLMDALETMCGVWVNNETTESDYIRKTYLTVTYQYFRTGILFAPLKSFAVEGEEISYRDEGDNLRLRSNSGYGTTYEVSFFQMNEDNHLFNEFLETVPEIDEEIWSGLQFRYGSRDKKFTLEELENRRTKIYEIYGTAPELSEEVSSYLEDITEDASTKLEKLKAIEGALSELTYNTNPGNLPEYVDSSEEFLDYFLLESKQGFCSYFATAFVLLARAEGYPARYVEGYCVPMEGKKSVEVYSEMAHAWPEVYFEGIGWIPFEPTPGYVEVRYTPWEEWKSRPSHGIVDPTISEYMEEEEEDILLPEGLPNVQATPKHQLSQIIGYSALIVGVILILFILIDIHIKKIRYKKWSLEKKFLTEVQRNLSILALLGYKRSANETLEELQERAWAVLHVEVEANEYTMQFLKLYEDSLYGGYAVQEEMLQTVRKERSYLLEELKKWKYVRYVFYRISAGSEK